MNSDRLTGETDLAYEYYKIYRDMPPAERSLRTLCDREVTGKKRSEAVFKRWSSVHEWQKRVAAYDVAVERAAYEEQFALRKAEINDFISADLSIARRVQKMCEMTISSITMRSHWVTSGGNYLFLKRGIAIRRRLSNWRRLFFWSLLSLNSFF